MHALEQLAARLDAARRITALTGAGVSAASGIPTFRGPGGFWRTFRAEDLATPGAFARDPRLVWEWYDWRRTLVAACEPNPAHHVLAAWMARDGFTLITQNVDGLHERARDSFRLKAEATKSEFEATERESEAFRLRAEATSRDAGAMGRNAGATDTTTDHVASAFRRKISDDRIIRMHGSIWELRCTGRCGEVWEDRSAPLLDLPPRCPRCGALARPNVVWFGESLDPAVLEGCAAALDCDVFLSIGTSSVVYPAAGLVHEAKRAGAFTVEINPASTQLSTAVDLVIPLAAEDALPAIHELRRASDSG